MSNKSGKKMRKRPSLKDRRASRRDEIRRALEVVEAELARVKKDLKHADLLTSVAQGLYEEIDKLSKKAPVDEATNLVVTHVNDVIRETRELAGGDPYVQRINEFVPAGNNPEHRDVVLVLKQLKQGLDRSHNDLKARRKRLTQRIVTAKGFIAALGSYIEDNETYPNADALSAKGASLADEWFGGTFGSKYVMLDRIDNLNVEEYFRVNAP